MSILWYDNQLPWFSQKQGIKKGNSIAPYIFVMCIEKLSHIICKAIDDGEWK